MLYYISRFAKKMHINKFIYVVLSPFYHSKVAYNNTEIKKAQKVVALYHQDPDNSCIGSNQLEICHDLQIIIPAYNVEEYIEECLNSVLNQQTDVDYIISVINDGSTDKTLDIIKRYASNPHIEIINQKNRGLSGERNRGLKTLKGKYVTFLDSDDRLADGAMDVLMDMAKQTDADIIQGEYKKFNNNGDQYIYHQNNSTNASFKDLYGFPWGKLYKSDMFEHIQFPDRYWFEDTLMAMILFPMAKKIATIDTLSYEYRLNPKGISSLAKHSPKALDSYYIMERLMEDRAALGLCNDNSMADFILNCQLPINEKRLGLTKREVNKAVFILSIAFINRYFPHYNRKNKVWDFLENHDYKGFRLFCLFHYA